MKDYTFKLLNSPASSLSYSSRRFLAIGALFLAALVSGPLGAQDYAAPPVVTPSTEYDGGMSTEEVFYGGSEYGYASGGPVDFSCAPTWHVRVEAMMLNREGQSGTSLSSGFRLNDFGFTEGGRVTVARKFDCAFGWDFQYMGLFEWEEAGQAVGAGTLNTPLVANGINLSAFNNADLHQQFYRSRIQSFEFNQKWWGWDVLSTAVGVRYINMKEEFGFRSVAGANEGLLAIQTNNNLIGAQLGLDLYYPVGKFSSDTTLKGGLFANFGDSDVGVANAGIVQVNNSTNDIEFAALVQLGTYLRYNLTRFVNIRAGYEFMWVYGLGIAVEQVQNPIGAISGSSFDGKGDVFYHGGSAGVEIIF